MRKFTASLAAALLVTGLLVSACSKNSETEAEKAAVDKLTDRAADAAVQKIKTPIDKARNAQDLGDDRLQAMDEALQKQ